MKFERTDSFAESGFLPVFGNKLVGMLIHGISWFWPLTMLAQSTIPNALDYQGRIMKDGVPFHGDGCFVFCMFDGDGVIHWNNWQGDSPWPGIIDGFDPKYFSHQPVKIPVAHGQFSIRLGEGGLAVNKKISDKVFFDSQNIPPRARPGMRLRVWFSSVTEPLRVYSRLMPDIEFTTVPFAVVAGIAEGVKPGSIDASSLAPGVVLSRVRPAGITAQMLMAPLSPELAAAGYAREAAPVPADGGDLFIYRHDPDPVYRLGVGIAPGGGDEIVHNQSDPLDLGVVDAKPVTMSLYVRNTGNQPLTGISVEVRGQDGSEFECFTVDQAVSLAGTTELVLTGKLNKGVSNTQSAEIAVTADGVEQALVFPVVKHSNFSRIPAGNFQMGHPYLNEYRYRPPATIQVSAFYIAKTLVSRNLWNEVRDWGTTRGYTDLPLGEGQGPDYPVHNVSWIDAVKWCNARSEMEKLTPVYTVSGSVMKTGISSNPGVNWGADGYRLPTEAEWEKAARGGLVGKRFPWGEEINHTLANYLGWGDGFIYDTSPHTTPTLHPEFNRGRGNSPHSSPVSHFPQNGYGLHDMAGNLFQWCHDQLGPAGYGWTTEPRTDPTGPVGFVDRVLKGGSSGTLADLCQVGIPLYANPNDRGIYSFRPVRR